MEHNQEAASMKKLSLRQRRVIEREIEKRKRMHPKPKQQPKEARKDD